MLLDFLERFNESMNVAIFLPGWIGDAVMATPAIRALKLHFPSGKFVCVSKSYVAPILAGNPWFDSMILTGGKKDLSLLEAASQLKKEKIDVAVLFPNSFRAGLLAWMGGCKRSIGFNRYFRKWLLSDSLESPQNAKGEFIPSPAIDSYNQLAMVAGAPNPGYEMQLFTSTVEEEMAEQVWRFAAFKDKPEVICLNPGAAFGASKLWPAEHFASLGRELIRLRGAGILVMCGPKESELALRITSLIGHPSARCLAEPGMPDLSLGLSKACIKKCQLLVTTDSGPRHFAAAFNKPVVSLFGPTHIEWTDTYHKKEINLQKKLPCGPCQKRVCPLEHQCMKELMPLDVLSAGVSLLDRQLESARFLRSVG